MHPTHFLKTRSSVIINNFLEYGTKQVTLYARQNDFMHCSLQVKQGIYSIVLKRESLGSKDYTKELKLECAYFLGQTS